VANEVDTGYSLIDPKALRAELSKMHRQAPPEMELRPIEKWMIKELGVERLPMKGGSAITYYHKALTNIGDGQGHFSIHKIHARNPEYIYKRNFKNYLYKSLMEIISILEAEGNTSA
jgi:hypothetical protein